MPSETTWDFFFFNFFFIAKMCFTEFENFLQETFCPLITCIYAHIRAYIYKYTVMCCLTVGIFSEKRVGKFHPWVNIAERAITNKPSWYSLVHIEAVWYSLLLVGYEPVQYVTAQNNFLGMGAGGLGEKF